MVDKRQKYNKAVFALLKGCEFFERYTSLPMALEIYDVLEDAIHMYPDWRFNQIFLNLIHIGEEDVEMHMCKSELFKDSCTPDPFFEEPLATYARLIRMEIFKNVKKSD